MPGRKLTFVNNHIYHVFNKTIGSKQIFTTPKMCTKFLEILRYYRSSKSRISFSKLDDVGEILKQKILLETTYRKYFRFEILAYCLMPTHFHLLLKQTSTNGIPHSMSLILNSFTRYANLLQESVGPIFLTKFKAVWISTEELLKHISRYIHLNPYSAGIVDTLGQLEQYAWSSYPDYLASSPEGLANTSDILDLFDNDRERYRAFVEANADYQKSLEIIKHAEKWV